MINFVKNDIIELNIDNLGINGEGIARIDGITVFVKGGLVGEKVRAKVILVKPNFIVAKLLEILVPSPHRIQSKCPIFNKCGGCSLQHLEYDEQLKYKQKLVKETFKKVGEIDVEVQPTIASKEIYGYRNKVSLPIRSVKGKIQMGFFMPASHNIIDATTCPLQKDEINKVCMLMREFLDSYGGKPYDENDGSGDIRHLVVRSIGNKIYVTVVLNQNISLKSFEKLLKENFTRYALYKNHNSQRNNVILGKKTEFVGGDTSPIDVEGLKIDVHPAGFFQVNDDIRQKIYNFVSQRVCGGKVIDAYSGAGLMTAQISKTASQIYGIEINEDAHVSALILKEQNGINNMFPILGDSGKVIKDLVDKNCVVILDPPRTGCSLEVTNALKDLDCDIIYISCNPATLARDVKNLGKTPKLVQPFDMFPQTPDVETVVIL